MAAKMLNDERKSVLMICYYFYPFSGVGALRSTKFAKYLGSFGWHVEVLTRYKTGDGNYFNDSKVRIYTVPNIDMDEIIAMLFSFANSCLRILNNIISVFKNGSKSTRLSNFKQNHRLGLAAFIRQWLRLPDSQFLWILFALPKALSLARKSLLVYTSLNPHSAHVLGLIIKKITKKPWVADYRDEWSLNPTWRPATLFHRRLAEKLDEACVCNADVVVNTTEIRTLMFCDRFGGRPEKYVTIHNGFDEEDIRRYRDTDPPQDCFVMTSIGSVNSPRDVTPLLYATANLLENGVFDEEKLAINIIGGCSPDLAEKIEKLEISHIVKALPRIPQDQAFGELAKSHVALLVGSYYEKVAMTTKAYEYAGMGKPIFALVPRGPLHDFIKNCGGWCAEPNSPDEIQKVLSHILILHKKKKLRTNKPPDFVRKYERRDLTKQLATYFNSCIS